MTLFFDKFFSTLKQIEISRFTMRLENTIKKIIKRARLIINVVRSELFFFSERKFGLIFLSVRNMYYKLPFLNIRRLVVYTVVNMRGMRNLCHLLAVIDTLHYITWFWPQNCPCNRASTTISVSSSTECIIKA